MGKFEIITEKGFKWIVRESSKMEDCTQDMLGPAERELYNFQVLDTCADKSKSFVDVGAHVGGFALVASKKFGKVYAFEPQPFNYIGLQKNIELNKITNIEAVNKGIGAISEQQYLYAKGGESNISLEGIPKKGALPHDKITIIRLDDFIFELPISIIKIDTEGYEEQVLVGANKTIAKYRPILLIETHDRTCRGDIMVEGQSQRIKEYLDNINYGYEIAFVSEQKNEHLICKPK